MKEPEWLTDPLVATAMFVAKVNGGNPEVIYRLDKMIADKDYKYARRQILVINEYARRFGYKDAIEETQKIEEQLLRLMQNER